MKRHSSPILPLVLVAAFGLAACGDTNPSVPDGWASDGLLSPRPIEIASGGGGFDSAPMAAESSTGDRASEMPVMPYWIAEYVLGAGLPGLPTNDVGYVFQRGDGATAEQVAALAAALGVTGEPVAVDPDFGGSWLVGPDDGTAPMLWVSNDAQISWNYNAAWADQGVRTMCVEAVSSDGTVTSDCPEPEPPAGVPTAAEAEQRARDLMVAVGENPAVYRFETYADEWFASVSAVQLVDGVFEFSRFDVGFGAEGVMQYASGRLAEPERVGPYPLIDLDTAVARLNDQRALWGGGFVGPATPAIAESGVGTAETGAAAPAVEPMPVEPMPVEPITDEPMPVEPMPVEPLPPADMPEPEPVTVTLVDVQADVWWAWDTDGAVWLLPAYRFIDTDGGWHVVPAVTDEFLVEVEAPIMIEPMPEPPSADPGFEPEPFDVTLLASSVGTTLTEFTAEAETFGASVRVVERDGVALEATADFQFNRVNVAVTGDVVTEIVSVG
ncbi:MAG TPA: hypothetical protein VIS05_06030 [Ilumatobacter sp.]